MANLLPDCMMPDGAEPCAGYQHAAEDRRQQIMSRDKIISECDARIDALEAERALLAASLKKADARVEGLKAALLTVRSKAICAGAAFVRGNKDRDERCHEVLNVIDDALAGPDEAATHIPQAVYQSAVKGRQDFREAYREQRARAKTLEAAITSLANSIEGSLEAFELAIREAIGNTNYAVIREKINRARAALAAGGSQ